jgi:hypothetical protein
VAAQQRNFCSFNGTSHFHLRQALCVFSFADRGWAVHKQSIFEPGEPQCANACGFFNGGYSQ